MRTARQGCITPALGRNVLLAGKPRPKTKLHPAVARRSYRPRGPTSPFLKRGQLTGPARRHEPAPPPRRSVDGSNGCSTQATAYLRATPPPRRGNSATPANTTGPSRFASSRRPDQQGVNVGNDPGFLTSQCGKQHWASAASRILGRRPVRISRSRAWRLRISRLLQQAVATGEVSAPEDIVPSRVGALDEEFLLLSREVGVRETPCMDCRAELS